MKSRLNWITNWEQRAKEAYYRANALAKDVGVCPQHLRLYILAKEGLTTKVWLQQLSSLESLQSRRDGKSVKAMAYDAGFKNSTHFSRTFRNSNETRPST
jgi:methylphosphotriester-DNA--protein-cysteine methyltransferase